MQKAISVKTQTGADFDLSEINSQECLGGGEWEVAQIATPVGCTATLVILQKVEPKKEADA